MKIRDFFFGLFGLIGIILFAIAVWGFGFVIYFFCTYDTNTVRIANKQLDSIVEIKSENLPRTNKLITESLRGDDEITRGEFDRIYDTYSEEKRILRIKELKE